MESIVGYVDNPAALLTRGLAHGLASRGNDVRVVEQRQNDAFVRTLRHAGADSSREFYTAFTSFQHHTFEQRTGPHLLEWVAREISLIDVAVAVDGLDQELCRWLANVTRENLMRVFLTFSPETLTAERAAALEIERFDLVAAPSPPSETLQWRSIAPTIAGQDRDNGLVVHVDEAMRSSLIDPIEAAAIFERAVSRA